MKELTGRIVLITGASSGIGRAAALRFAGHGARPILAARSVGLLEELAAEIEQQTGRLPPVYRLDVQDKNNAEQVVQNILAEVGPVDILVNNAGYGLFRAATELSMEEIEDMMEVNYFGLVRMTKLLLPSMIERGDGLILNIASMASFFASPKHGCYAATKFAVQGFSEGLRYELLGTGVSVSTVNPGPVDTPFYERADRTRSTVPSFARFLTDEQVVDAVIEAAVERKPLYLLPKVGGVALKFKYLFPRLYDGVMKRVKKG